MRSTIGLHSIIRETRIDPIVRYSRRRKRTKVFLKIHMFFDSLKITLEKVWLLRGSWIFREAAYLPVHPRALPIRRSRARFRSLKAVRALVCPNFVVYEMCVCASFTSARSFVRRENRQRDRITTEARGISRPELFRPRSFPWSSIITHAISHNSLCRLSLFSELHRPTGCEEGDTRYPRKDRALCEETFADRRELFV